MKKPVVKRTRRNIRKEQLTDLIDAHKDLKKARRTPKVHCPGCGSEEFWFRWRTSYEDCLLICECGFVGGALDAGVDRTSLYVQASPIVETSERKVKWRGH